MASWVLAMPHFAMTNTDMPTGVRMAAAILSMALGVIAIDGLIRLGTGQWRLLPQETSATATASGLNDRFDQHGSIRASGLLVHQT
jgi:hypothetical protein